MVREEVCGIYGEPYSVRREGGREGGTVCDDRRTLFGEGGKERREGGRERDLGVRDLQGEFFFFAGE